MSWAYAALGGLLVSAIGGLIAALVHVSKDSGAATAELKYVEKEAQNAHVAGTIIAENRTVDDTAGSLSAGKF